MRRFLLGLTAMMALTGAARAFDPTELEQRMAVLRMGAEQLRWQEVPWLSDLAEGMRLAKQEKRPLLLWAIDDEPLERC